MSLKGVGPPIKVRRMVLAARASNNLIRRNINWARSPAQRPDARMTQSYANTAAAENAQALRPGSLNQQDFTS